MPPNTEGVLDSMNKLISLAADGQALLLNNMLQIKTKTDVQDRDNFGSAWLHFPEDEPNLVFLFTARHCLFGDEATQYDAAVTVEVISAEPIIVFKTTDADTQLLTFEEQSQADDLAILVVPRTLFSTYSVVQVAFSNVVNDLETCQLIGFPEMNNGQIKDLIAEFVSRSRGEADIFNIFPKQNLQTEYSFGEDAVKGMSGGLVYVVQNGNPYLLGIPVEFLKDYKEVVVISFERVNVLLKKAHFEPLSITYSNTLGLTSDKLAHQLKVSCKYLGSRYQPQLNFELPIAQIFNGLAFDDIFQNQVKTAFHNLLRVIKKCASGGLSEPDFAPYKRHFEQQFQDFSNFYQSKVWSAGSNDFSFDALENLKKMMVANYEQTREIQDSLDSLNYQKKKALGKENDPYYNPLSWSLRVVNELWTDYREFDAVISDTKFTLATSPFLILKGKAGAGKSHLLADVASQREQRGLPTILILGQKLTKGDVWQQITTELGLNYTRDVLLETLNNIGKHIGSRVLLMIDAINEGEAKTTWKDNLAGFFEILKPYPFIGLVVAVRSTYYKLTVPESLREDPSVSTIEHRSFEGHEWEVIQHFCKNYGFETPRFPVLSPEFSNAQFLFLLCESLKNQHKTVFPSGANGIAWLYKTFAKGINEKLMSRPEFEDKALTGINFVEEAIRYFANKVADTEGRRLPVKTAFLLFNGFEYCPNPHFLQILLDENILLKDMYGWGDEQEELIQFSYERFGDFAIARRLLDKYFDPQNPTVAFAEGGYLKNYFQKDFHWKQGVFDAVILYLAENHNLEIFEVITDKWFDFGDHVELDKRRFHPAFLNSLEWRSMEKIDFDKIKGYINAEILRGYAGVNFFLWQLQFATIPNHPLNIEFLHQHLMKFELARRDSWWVESINNEFVNDHSTIKIIVNWARSAHAQTVDDEVAQLAATTLAWFFAATHPKLRDGATLAMVNLLQNKPHIMQAILQKFRNVNDPYISERLYAAAQGVAVRSLNTEGVRLLAQWVYDTVFKNGEPPVHILLREYAQNVVEWALYLKLTIEVDVALLRPPYNSLMPQLPTAEEIKQYKIDYDSAEFKKDEWRVRAQNHLTSFIESDVDRFDKTYSGVVENFHIVSFRDKAICKDFKSRLKGKTKTSFQLIVLTIEIIYQPQTRYEHIRVQQEKMRETFKSDLPKFVEKLSEKLSKEDGELLKTRIIPYLHAVEKAKRKGYNRRSFEAKPIGRWMAKRIFDLGWKKDWHGEYDGRLLRWRDYSLSENEAQVETIGKKYRWIAFHEILAILTDNYYHDTWRTSDKPMPFRGTWEMYLRNIDPTLTLKSASKESEWEREEIMPYSNWDMPNSEWLNTKEGLPSIAKIVTQPPNTPPQYQWLNLYCNPDWQESTAMGQEKYDALTKDLWYQVRSYLVKESEEEAIVAWLSGQNFLNHWMPQEEEHHTIFYREFYWSAAYKDANAGRESKRIWKTFGHSQHQGIVTSESFSAGGGSYKLQDGIHFHCPSLYLFKKMNLRYNDKDGEWIDAKGEVVIYDPSVSSPQKSSLLVRRDVFEAFLKANKLAVVWTILGEKRLIGGIGFRSGDGAIPLVINGVYSLKYGLKLGTKPYEG
jgi:hypothetical protein